VGGGYDGHGFLGHSWKVRESGDISHHHLLLEIRATASTVTGGGN
jgi:hypothetical protein